MLLSGQLNILGFIIFQVLVTQRYEISPWAKETSKWRSATSVKNVIEMVIQKFRLDPYLSKMLNPALVYLKFWSVGISFSQE